jgi:hypothetical protein
LQSLKNHKNHRHLIEEIRRTALTLEKQNWHVMFNWIRAHAGYHGNELADKLPKEAAGKETIAYDLIPISAIARQGRDRSLELWQKQWDSSTKGRATKEFFPNVQERLNTKLIVTSQFTAFVSGHGLTRSYLHRFRRIESPDCPCGGGSQTTDRLLFHCVSLQEDRERLIGNIARLDSWPVSKRQLESKHIKEFIRFTRNIDFTKFLTCNLKCFHNLQCTDETNLKTSKISVF